MDPKQCNARGGEKRGEESEEGRGGRGARGASTEGERRERGAESIRTWQRREASMRAQLSNPHSVSIALFDDNLEFEPFFERFFYFCWSALDW